jgi:hypothetical protein
MGDGNNRGLLRISGVAGMYGGRDVGSHSYLVKVESSSFITGSKAPSANTEPESSGAQAPH